MNAEVNSGNRIKSGTRIKLHYKDSWSPLVALLQTISDCVCEWPSFLEPEAFQISRI